MPKRMDVPTKEERRIERMVISLTPDEKQALEAYVEDIHYPLGTWARDILLKAAGLRMQS